MRRILIMVLLLVFPSVVMAGEPTEILKVYTDKVIKVLEDPKLNKPQQRAKRYEILKSIVLEIFDIEELSKRTLGRHWRNMSIAERKEFQDVFLKFLEKHYANRIDKTIGEKFSVEYVYEKIRGKYALVKSIIKTSTKGQYPVYYRMIRKKGRWVVYDVVIEGVSLVKNYRDQFREILSKKSYKELISMLKKKISEDKVKK